MKSIVLFIFVILVSKYAFGDDNYCIEPSQTSENIKQLIQKQVEGYLSASYEQLELNILTPLPNNISKIVVLNPINKLNSRIPFDLLVNDCKSGKTSKVTIWTQLRLWKKIWVYGKDTESGNALSVTLPQQKSIDVMSLQLNLESLVNNIDGLWLQKTVRANAPILKTDLKLEPLIKKNQPIHIVVRGEGFAIKTKGMSLQEGGSGERILVMVNSASKSITATVIDKDTVNVEI